ncbi:hypothetical protein JRO89_XS04G0180700 [Xanthoceras sorbifolium]|uniref:Uncharacterized protein n=1 Tax=Xanthoceras sorbifolium TaxID=99658 RepID=A0ABQ8I683_9ROSI|nr:hypothetical protein JRO89_XS04G0180700 [Xanthoceras sorbifolium]
MGMCWSGDVRGGKQAVGGRATEAHNNSGGHNDAVDFFFRSRGLHALFTQIEMLQCRFLFACGSRLFTLLLNLDNPISKIALENMLPQLEHGFMDPD